MNPSPNKARARSHIKIAARRDKVLTTKDDGTSDAGVATKELEAGDLLETIEEGDTGKARQDDDSELELKVYSELITTAVNKLPSNFPSKMRVAFLRNANLAVQWKSMKRLEKLLEEVPKFDEQWREFTKICDLQPQNQKEYAQVFEKAATLEEKAKLLAGWKARSKKETEIALLTVDFALEDTDLDQRIECLQELRAGGGVDDAQYRAAMVKVFKAMEPEYKKFLEAEKGKRQEVLSTLRNQKFAKSKFAKPGAPDWMKDQKLEDVRNNWDQTADDDKLSFLGQVAGIQAKAHGFDAIPINEIPAKSAKEDVTGGFFAGPPPEILLNTSHDNFKDFDKMLDTIIHENTHAYQHHLVKMLEENKLKKGDALYNQAVLFQLNEGEGGNIKDGPGTMSQPAEYHAYLAGIEARRMFDSPEKFRGDLIESITQLMSMAEITGNVDEMKKLNALGAAVLAAKDDKDALCKVEFDMKAYLLRD